ncbi:MAG TPA: radical SAM protein, partial [Fibrobacteraceae bacterium]|nr:radical SAM protein [Fibrobacteraceae bacterium]
YCYQESYAEKLPLPSDSLVDSFFSWMDTKLAGRRKYVTLFGGEPLLPGSAHRNFLLKFVRQCAAHKVDIAVVTNGYNLAESLDILSQARVREIQVTLDGPRELHDQRRRLKGGGSSFDRIVEGIDATLAQGITVNLRMVVDRENLPSLPELARFAMEKGWTSNPHFKTQLGRNYELHSCQTGRSKLYSRLELHQELFQLIQEHPEVLEFHRPAFSISRFLFENGQLPEPLFDSCTGAKTEWALDGSGRVYSCTATVGKPGEELGTFWPKQEEKADVVADWQDRDVCSVAECKDCAVRLACGGGCASVAKNQHGSVLSPDCRPVRELLSLGVALYNQTELVQE